MNNSTMTTWQRAVLVAMYGVACNSADPTKVWFTRRAIEHLLWIDWHGYHTAKIEQLVRQKWLEKGITAQGIRVYRLTPPSHGSISVDVGNAVAECRIDIAENGQLKLL